MRKPDDTESRNANRGRPEIRGYNCVGDRCDTPRGLPVRNASIHFRLAVGAGPFLCELADLPAGPEMGWKTPFPCRYIDDTGNGGCHARAYPDCRLDCSAKCP